MTIKRFVPEWEQDIFWNHTKERRTLETLKSELKRRRIGYFQYDYESHQLTFYWTGETEPESVWHLNGDFIRSPSAHVKNVRLSEREILLIGLWTSVRAAIWMSAQSSKPLLNFVDDLDPNVYVL